MDMPTKSYAQALVALAAAKAPLSRGPSLILPRLYLSNYAFAASAPELDKLGVTHIVSVLDGPTLPACPEHIKRLHVKLQDNFNENILKHLEKTTAFIRGALEEGEDHVVLVHCLMGISRSATVVWAYLVACTPMGLDEALDFLISKRSVVCPNIGFRIQMETYAETVCSKVVQDPEATPKARVTRLVVQHAMRLRERKAPNTVQNTDSERKDIDHDEAKTT